MSAVRPCHIYQGVLIPGCMAVAHSDDRRDCTCKREPTIDRRDARRLVKRIEQLEKRVEELSAVLRTAAP